MDSWLIIERQRIKDEQLHEKIMKRHKQDIDEANQHLHDQQKYLEFSAYRLEKLKQIGTRVDELENE